MRPVRETLTDLVQEIGAPTRFTVDDVVRRGRTVRRRRITVLAAVGVATALAGTVAIQSGRPDSAPHVGASPSAAVTSDAPQVSTPPATPPASATSTPTGPSRASGHPGAANTGVPAGTKLTRHVGDQAIRVDGTVIDGWDLAGSLDIYANNVTIRNSRIVTSNWWAVNLRAGYTGLKVLHSTLSGAAGQGPNHGAEDYAVSSAGGTVEVGYCDISKFANALSIAGGSVHDSYLHGVQFFTGDGGRWQGTNGIVANGGGLTIRHNTVLNDTPAGKGGTSAIGLFADSGPVSDVVVDDNLLGGGQYAFYGGGTGAARIRVTNNRFTTVVFASGGFYGPVSAWNAGGTGNVWSGNVWADGPQAGRAVTP